MSTRAPSGPVAAARELEPPERRTLALHSGAMQMAQQPSITPRISTRSNMQPMHAARFVPAPEPGAEPEAPRRSRLWIAGVSLLAGLLVGVIVAVWMHMSQETAPPPAPTPRPAALVPPLAAPPAPVAAAVEQAPVAPPTTPEPAPATVESEVADSPSTKPRPRKRSEPAPATDLKNPFSKQL